MKRVLLMALLLIYPRLLVAQDLDVDALLGEDWYGLYLNGAKSGFLRNAVFKDDIGNIVVEEEARFKMNMGGFPQDMSVLVRRTYGADGGLLTIHQRVVDNVNQASVFNARVEGDELVLVAEVGGNTREKRLPKPKESLSDAVKYAEWMQNAPQPGDTIGFTLFDLLYEREISGVSHIVGVEERVLDSTPTKVYRIKTSLDVMNIDTLAYVAEDGTTLEDTFAGMITMRLEPEEIAKDVDYSNDVIVSNAAFVDTPIENPRGRDALRLVLRGPLKEDLLFNDERQYIEKQGEEYKFLARRISLDGFEPAPMPVTHEEVRRWLKPTTFVQSDDPALIAKAREVLGIEEGEEIALNTLEVSNRLCAWVNDNVRTTFSARLTNALEVLDSLEGDCTEHSILFIGLARAIGLPAREVAGLIYVETGKPGFYFHQWAKVWIGKWIDVDPTFNQPLADATHIKLAEGDLFQQMKLIPIIGNLKIDVVPDTTREP